LRISVVNYPLPKPSYVRSSLVAQVICRVFSLYEAQRYTPRKLSASLKTMVVTSMKPVK